MLEVTVLASGSAGNAMLVRSGSTAVLVDAGLSARQIAKRLEACGENASNLSGILLTHEHHDHSSALRVLCDRYEIPVYCNRLTAESLSFNDGLSGCQNWRYFASGGSFSIGGLTVSAFSVPHDAADPVGFTIANGTASIGIVTDLGFATNAIFDRIRHVKLLLIETNHDEQMLQADTKRPWSVKQRILSRHGHLSNRAAATFISSVAAGSDLTRVVLGHISRDCNHPALAAAAVRDALSALGRQDIECFCAEQNAISPKWAVA